MKENKFKKLVLREDFIFYCLIAGLIAIVSMIIYGTVISIVEGSPWEKVEGCVENTFLTFCLLAVIIGLKKGNHEIFHKLFGELLAIYLVTNTSHFIETLEEVIEHEAMIYDYIFLVMKFAITLLSIIVFLDHLFESSAEKEHKGKVIIKIMLVIVLVMMIFDLVGIFLYGDKEHTLRLINEFIFFIFGTALALTVYSYEMRRIESEEKDK